MGATRWHPMRCEVSVHFEYDGGGIGKGGTATLIVDGEVISEGRIEKTTRAIFSMNEQLDVGINRGSPVAEEFAEKGTFRYGGKLHSVTVDLRSTRDVVSAEEREKISLGRALIDQATLADCAAARDICRAAAQSPCVYPTVYIWQARPHRASFQDVAGLLTRCVELPGRSGARHSESISAQGTRTLRFR